MLPKILSVACSPILYESGVAVCVLVFVLNIFFEVLLVKFFL